MFRAAALGLAGLLLAGCGYDAAPQGYGAASTFSCPEPLAGTWLLGDAQALAWLAGGRPLPPERFTTLQLAPRSDGDYEVQLRRPVADVIAQARTLRMTRPDDYRYWRAQQLRDPEAQRLRPPTDLSSLPVTHMAWQIALPDCRWGWRTGAAPRSLEGGDRLIGFPSVTLDAAGNLLLKLHVREPRDSGWVFFGQGITYYTFREMRWARLHRATDAARTRALVAADLPPAPGPRERLQIEQARREQPQRFDYAARRALGPEVQVSVLRRRGFDPGVLSERPGEVDMEIAGRYPGDRDDPFAALLRGHPQVHGVQLREARSLNQGLEYRRYDFVLRLALPD